VGTGDLPHEQDDGEHGQGRCRDLCAAAEVVVHACRDHCRPGAGEDEEKRAEHLAEQPAPFVAGVMEVLQPGVVRGGDA